MNEHFLYPGTLLADKAPYAITTVLGSCISVCLWDPQLRHGGMNHYLLPLWNGEGLASPKYGNIAIAKLIEKVMSFGSTKRNLQAKVFGGAAMMESSSGLLNVGERNILIAQDILFEEKIMITGSDVGGNQGRKIIFNTETGVVLVKKVKKSTG
ncbi:chemotaxis protein CheD [Candidatus Magnetomonas plexicatena]|uniref:chemotaxis protein CheD n=1 Tax=Candidatus Magnetomonas plexicatena TaxID=2552947 RepID=UPI001C754083|nr:chemotaxis protein CheD [Nitrospirales bacterium LBB_01]